jgi:hypothetical protein
MPAPPAPRRPEPDRPDAEAAPPRRKFRHQTPIEEDTGERVERGHGSGCIPIIVIRFSVLALMVWLALLASALIVSRQLNHPHSATPVVKAHP